MGRILSKAQTPTLSLGQLQQLAHAARCIYTIGGL